MTPPRIFTNFINGEWVPSASGRTFENVNPANRSDLIGYFQRSGPEDVDAAIAAARNASKILIKPSNFILAYIKYMSTTALLGRIAF